MSTDDLTPDIEDVLQEQPAPVPMTPIPVVLEGPADTRQLPTRSPGMATLDLTVDPTRVLQDDPRRSRAILQVAGDAVILGTSQSAATHAGARLADGTTVTLTTSGEVWARAGTGTATLSVISEQWAR